MSGFVFLRHAWDSVQKSLHMLSWNIPNRHEQNIRHCFCSNSVEKHWLRNIEKSFKVFFNFFRKKSQLEVDCFLTGFWWAFKFKFQSGYKMISKSHGMLSSRALWDDWLTQFDVTFWKLCPCQFKFYIKFVMYCTSYNCQRLCRS